METVFKYEDGPSKDDALEIADILYQGKFSDRSIEEAKHIYDSLNPDRIIEMAIYSMLKNMPNPEPTEELYKYIQKEKSQTDDSKQYKEGIYSSVLGAIEANEFKSVDILFDFLKGLEKRDIFTEIYADIRGTGKKANSRYDFTLPVRIFNALLNESFDEKLTGNLEKWLHIYFPKTIFDTFDFESPPDKHDFFPIDKALIEESIDEALRSIMYQGEECHTGRYDIYDFTYIEKVNRISKVLDFIGYLSTGEKTKKKWDKSDSPYLHIYNDIYDRVTSDPDDYFDIDTAIRTIRQNNGRHKDGAVEKSLNVLELINDCNGTKPEKEIQTILKNYIGTEHPIWPDIRDRKVIDKLKRRMIALYQNTGGNLNDLKTDAQIFLEQQKARQNEEAARQKELIEQERQKAAEQREWEKLNILPVETSDADFEIGQKILFEVHKKHGRKITGNVINMTGNESTVPDNYGQKVKASLPSNSGISNNMTCVGTVKNAGAGGYGLVVYDVKEYVPASNTENKA